MGNEGLGSAVKMPPITQVGMVVRDLDKTIEFYTSVLGIGPWRRTEIKSTQEEEQRTGRRWKVRIGLAPMGPVELELVEPTEGRTLPGIILESKGEGVYHVGVKVTDMDGMLKKLEAAGIKASMRGTSDRSQFAYLTTHKVGGLIFELIQPKGSQPVLS